MTLKQRIGAVVASALAAGALAVPAVSAAPAPGTPTLIGASSRDWAWFDRAVGPQQVYRGFDGGFHYSTWSQVPYKLSHNSSGRMNDYSFRIPPAALARGDYDSRLTTFIASTPKTINLTNIHEPEQETEAGQFSFSNYRKAIARLNTLTDAVNANDGGTRTVSVILMISTFRGFKGRSPENFWPTVAKGDGGTADIQAADVYASVHGTGTVDTPAGYTDGIAWVDPTVIFNPLIAFAKAHSTDWAVSELGYLEYKGQPNRKGDALRTAVAVATAGGGYRPALWVCYFDNSGGRADWQLRHSQPPVPSTSDTSYATRVWDSLTP